jgi:hypothetical protein
MRLTTTLSLALLSVVVACAPSGEQAGAAADSTARNLTLAPAESTRAQGDVPAPAATPAATPAPQSRPPAPRPAAPPKPAAPTSYTLAVGTSLGLAVTDTITSRTAKAGDAFTASVASDVKDRSGRVVIPAGATVHGTVVEVKPAPNSTTSGTMSLAVSSVSVGGQSYAIEASIDSVATVMKGRGVTGGDAAKVGAGAAAGAILGRVLGKNAKGTVIGGVVGGAVGAGIAAGTKDVDIVVPAGARIVVTLTKALTVKA